VNIDNLKNGDMFFVKELNGRYILHMVLDIYEEYYKYTNKNVKRVDGITYQIYTKKDTFHKNGVYIIFDKGRSEYDIKSHKELNLDKNEKILLINTIFKYGVIYDNVNK